MVKQFTKEEIRKLRKEANLKSLNAFAFTEILRSMDKEEREKVLKEWNQEIIRDFPRIASLVIKYGVITKEEFDRDWNNAKMYDIFSHISSGNLEKARKTKEEIVMVTDDRWQLRRKKQIFFKFGIIVSTPKQAYEKLKKENPGVVKKVEDMMRDETKARDYIG